MIVWPQSLIAELAARRCLLFLGAGVSMSATKVTPQGPVSPPMWEAFLQKLLANVNRGTANDQKFAAELLNGKRYLECAQILRETCLQNADYNRIVGECFESFQPTGIHGYLDAIDQKVVVTTNFDSIYEDHCRQGDAVNGYAVVNYYDDNLISRLRSPKRVIIKAHGSVAAPENTVLSKSDYFKARRDYPGFFKILESLFLTHTLVFLGYSLNDPDIQLLLETVSLNTKSDHPHYAVMAEGIHPAMKKAFLETYNIEILEFDPQNNYAAFQTSVEELANNVTTYREEQLNE